MGSVDARGVAAALSGRRNWATPAANDNTANGLSQHSTTPRAGHTMLRPAMTGATAPALGFDKMKQRLQRAVAPPAPATRHDHTSLLSAVSTAQKTQIVSRLKLAGENAAPALGSPVVTPTSRGASPRSHATPCAGLQPVRTPPAVQTATPVRAAAGRDTKSPQWPHRPGNACEVRNDTLLRAKESTWQRAKHPGGKATTCSCSWSNLVQPRVMHESSAVRGSVTAQL